jgi:hypothetical protein
MVLYCNIFKAYYIVDALYILPVPPFFTAGFMLTGIYWSLMDELT